MYKLSHKVENDFIEYSHAPYMEVTEMANGGKRLVAGVPVGDASVFSALINCLPEPYYLLYLLHTPRGEAEAGRYQSPALSAAEVTDFLSRYSSYLGQDARHDLWLYSIPSKSTVVWDRHNLIYAYGPLEKFQSALFGLGFSLGDVPLPFPHGHYYRAEYDQDASAVLEHWEWSRTDLQPEDEQ